MDRLSRPGCRNARDVGGLPTVDRGAVRAGALVRADSLDRRTPARVAALRARRRPALRPRVDGAARGCLAVQSLLAAAPTIQVHVGRSTSVLSPEISGYKCRRDGS